MSDGLVSLVEALDGPHEWGYRGLAGEGFIEDTAPYAAAAEITRMSEALATIVGLSRLTPAQVAELPPWAVSRLADIQQCADAEAPHRSAAQ